MKKFLFLLLFGTLLAGACARVPTQVQTAKIAQKHFSKYGKKYKDTLFSSSAVSSVDVRAVKELQKDMATSLMVVKLEDGTEVPVIMTLIRKFPGGWRTTSWEWVRQ